MTRQYVGARYVPKFASPVEWSNDRSYEALEIVTHLGTSFTSKMPVPVGVDISNETYWACTGNYNAQVELYREEVENLIAHIANMDYLDNKVIHIWGDSISTPGTSDNPRWVDILDSKLPDSAYVANMSSPGKFISGYEGIAYDMTQASSASMDCNILILFAGVNDFRHSRELTNGTDNDWSTFAGALKTISNQIRTKIPGCNVFVVSPLKEYQANDEDYPEGHDAKMPLILYRNSLRNWACQQGFTYIDGYAAPMLNPANTIMRSLYQSDGVHPNSTYSPLLCEYIYNKILTNSPVHPDKELVRIAGDSFANSEGTVSNFSIDVNEMGNAHISLTISDSITAGTPYELFELPTYLYPIITCNNICRVSSGGNVAADPVIFSAANGKATVTPSLTGSAVMLFEFDYALKISNSLMNRSL